LVHTFHIEFLAALNPVPLAQFCREHNLTLRGHPRSHASKISSYATRCNGILSRALDVGIAVADALAGAWCTRI
jgi:hypothetical protein